MSVQPSQWEADNYFIRAAPQHVRRLYTDTFSINLIPKKFTFMFNFDLSNMIYLITTQSPTNILW